ncbi:AAA family ATPase [Arthrobacter sp. KK5.5]|uniref:AAA family ATPase n=1 Tax=Arthrobacter sp. KK5.5 TaxID=3373084 RepID=UPI003EE6A785
MSRFVLITPEAHFEERVRSAIEGALPGELKAFLTADVPEQLEDLFAAIGPEPLEVLILGPGVPHETALRFATIIDVQHPEISSILVAEPTPELVLQAMRAGMRDVVDPSADVAAISVLLEHACQASASRRRTLDTAEAIPASRGSVVGVLSPKGGVGKTTIATNLAVGLAKLAPMGVVLVDLDLQFGDVASGLYLDPEHTITDGVSPAARNDSLVLKAYLSVHPAGFYALCAPKNPADADSITTSQVARLIDQLAGEFRYVVLDTAPGLEELALTAVERCTDIVWVSGMDIPSLRGLRSTLSVLKQLDLLPPRQHMVLNMADSKSGLSVQDVESSMGVPVDISVPRSRAVAYSTNSGIPLLQQGRRDPARKGLRELVERFDPEAKGRRKSHRRVVVK